MVVYTWREIGLASRRMMDRYPDGSAEYLPLVLDELARVRAEGLAEQFALKEMFRAKKAFSAAFR